VTYNISGKNLVIQRNTRQKSQLNFLALCKCERKQNKKFFWSSVAIPDHFDPDPIFHFDMALDPDLDTVVWKIKAHKSYRHIPGVGSGIVFSYRLRSYFIKSSNKLIFKIQIFHWDRSDTVQIRDGNFGYPAKWSDLIWACNICLKGTVSPD
jgi:hypothetical protein